MPVCVYVCLPACLSVSLFVCALVCFVMGSVVVTVAAAQAGEREARLGNISVGSGSSSDRDRVACCVHAEAAKAAEAAGEFKVRLLR